ncbi:HAD family hydrolase [Angustibacter peucedani]
MTARATLLGGRLDAVLLDVDDTLVDTQASFAAGMRAVAGEYLPHRGTTGPADALSHWLEDRGGHYARYAAGELDFLTQRRLRADALMADLGGPRLDDDGFTRWNDTYEQAFRAAWTPVDDAVALVEALVRAGVPTGAVTNHETSHQRRKLAGCGLGALPVLVGTDTLGVGKPDPRLFHLACELAGTERSRTAYVGNDLAVDAVGARDAGLRGVWLDRGVDHRGRRDDGTGRGEVPDGVHVVGSLGELAAWLGLDLDLGGASGDR